jgi:hypothetical protein
MSYAESFSLEETRCEVKTLTNFRSKLKFYEEIFNFYKKIFDKNHENQKLKRHVDIVVFLLNAKIIKSLYCLSSILKKGHYPEFQALHRNTIESIYLCKFLFEHPSESTKWLEGEQIVHNSFSKGSHEDENLKGLYGKLCDFTHSNFHSIYPDLEFRELKSRLSYKIAPYYQKHTTYFLIVLQVHFTFLALENYIEIAKKQGKTLNVKDAKEFENIKQKLKKFYENWGKFDDNFKNKSK